MFMSLSLDLIATQKALCVFEAKLDPFYVSIFFSPPAFFTNINW